MINFNKEKDFIAIIAPASSCDNAVVKLQEIKKKLATQGFNNLLIDDRIFSDETLKFFATKKETRQIIFTEALLDPRVKIIWAFRGGYGCDEFIFDCLDIKPVCPKILIGYSDITSMHLLFNQQYNMKSLHGSVLTSLLPPHDQELNIIIEVLSGKETFIKLTPANNMITYKKISGATIGGNLTILTTMIGTKLHPKTFGKILIVEDVNEVGYRILRSLIHLKNAGIFDRLNAIIFGDFTVNDKNSNENSYKNMQSAILYFCKQHIPNIPAYLASGIGHGKVNQAIVMNQQAIIEDNYLKVTSPFSLDIIST